MSEVLEGTSNYKYICQLVRAKKKKKVLEKPGLQNSDKQVAFTDRGV